MDDVFAVQDEIARTVVEKLKVKILGTDAPLVKAPTDNLEAYNLVLQGRHHSVRATAPAVEKGLACFTQALSVEATYAQAHAGIAFSQALLAIMGLVEPHAIMPKAKEAALKALRLDETVAEAHFALGYVLGYYEWDWAGAERAYRRALELNPGDAFARVSYAALLATCGRVDDVPHPVPWTHICAMPPGVAHTPRAPRSACDTQASRGARSGCTAPRSRPRRRGRPRGSERFGRGSLAP